MLSGIAEVTVLLQAWRGGDKAALGRLTPLMYNDLYSVARRLMARQGPEHLLQNTALLNETYVKLAQMGEVDWQDRGHFLAVATVVMRRVLTDYARSRLYLKRGGGTPQVPFDDNLVLPNRNPATALVALDDALSALASFDERLSQIVQLRVFVGLSVAETADVLHISERTVKREWTAAKAWMLRELDPGKKHGK